MDIDGIAFSTSLDGVQPGQLTAAFVGWPQRPTAEQQLLILRRSDRVVIARDIDNDAVVGFACALTDGLIAAYITLLEVTPSYQRRGIGTELMRRMLDSLSPLYMIDLLCDEHMVGFYRRLGGTRAVGVAWRDRAALIALSDMHR